MCEHDAPVQEYQAIVDQYKDRLTFEFYDGPLAGSAACQTCGQLFLFIRDEDGDGRTQWYYYPISSEAEQQLQSCIVDPFELAESLKKLSHMRVVEYWNRSRPSRAEWLLTTVD